MGEPTLLEKLQELIHTIVYRISLPIYLWSIREKSLDSYLTAVEKMHAYKLIEDFVVFVNEYDGNSASLRVLEQQFLKREGIKNDK